jgi:F0F1-type ATP synthase membrane subunit b/b'
MFKVLVFGFSCSISILLYFLLGSIKKYFNLYIQSIKNEISSVEQVNFDSIELLQQTKDVYLNIDNSFLTIYNDKIEELAEYLKEQVLKIDDDFEDKQRSFLKDLAILEKKKKAQITDGAIDDLMESLKVKNW